MCGGVEGRAREEVEAEECEAVEEAGRIGRVFVWVAMGVVGVSEVVESVFGEVE